MIQQRKLQFQQILHYLLTFNSLSFISTIFCTYILTYEKDNVKMNRLDKVLNDTPADAGLDYLSSKP